MTKKSIFHYALSSLLVGGIALSVTSCADDDINPNRGNDGDALVRFSINDVQEQAVSRGLEMTRGAIANGITTADLAGHKLAAHSNRNIDVCLIETTVEGVNPIKADAHTRANIATAISGDFSSTGIRGVAENSILSTPEWFKAVKTKQNGELYTPIRWSIAQPWARFFAVYPSKDSYSKLTINDMASADNAPSVDFTVEPNVNDQKDFMTACTGKVHYATQGGHPTTSLDFRHALTAIRFAVGQNLSWNKTIDKVEIRNAIMTSKYKLSNEFNGTGADWDNTGATRGTATLSGVSVSTSRNPNVTIMGTTGDNYTFYMIPQELTGKGVTVYVHCTDGTTITVPLKGEWKAGTTRTYKLSQTNSNWNYVLTATDPSRAAEYDETTSQAYTITSYRENSGTRQAVAWKVIGYSVDNGVTWTNNKPTWMTALSKESGDGAPYSAEAGTATLTKDVKDLLKERNDGLKNAPAVGSASAPYDLSLHNYQGATTARNTANSYLISAPGHYRIPLVYGNAIKNGATNSNAYETTATGTYVLQHFKDHNNQNITNPWIEKTNSGAYAGIDGAKIVWADEKDLVHLASPPIVHDASGNAYLDFEVKQADIKSGNAVVAVTKGGTVVWSWHLWFAPKSALNKIEVTNHQGVKYNFTEETLGWKPKGTVTTYNSPRTVKVKVEQTIANGGVKQVTVINITQNNGGKKEGISTHYQFGRKDAFPGMDETQLPQGSINRNAGDNMSITNGIQNPQNFYTWGSSWYNNPPAGYSYYNLWSADNTTTGYNDNNVIKTVYDPCPVGFKMPASNAFTGFTSNGQYGSGAANINANGTADSWDKFSAAYGHNFYTNSSKNATIFSPASGFRNFSDGSLYSVGSDGYCWSAVPGSTNNGCFLYFYWSGVYPQFYSHRSFGFAVRPVSE